MKPSLIIILLLSVICFISCNDDSESATLAEVTFHDFQYESDTLVNCKALINNSGNCAIIECGFCWGTNSSPTISDNVLKCQNINGEFSGIVYLPKYQLYYIRPYVINEMGISYGPENEFIYQPPQSIDNFIKTLVGDADKEKHWVLDTAGVYFHNPLDFYGDNQINSQLGNYGPFGGTNFYDWNDQGAENGSILFEKPLGLIKKSTNNGYLYGVTTLINGIETSGDYTFTIYERNPNFLMLSEGISLWNHMLNGQYSYLKNLSEKMADLYLPDNIRFPIDSTRFYENYIKEDDFHTITIMHLTDSAMIVRILQTYDSEQYLPQWLLYNYIVKEYNYQN